MTTVALALVSRVIPQLNVFIILPLVQVLVGTVMIIVSIRVTVVTFEFLFGELSKDLHTLIMAM
jgi:flagellar biosynthesis protein FliR